ncbi:DNA methyltransferase [Halobacteriovorax sp. GFR7]|uniref:DNA methyltransferase n=1 Tax=unclassified Halobacteriovorax TaxID=2639665 RepID=UPI003D986874
MQNIKRARTNDYKKIQKALTDNNIYSSTTSSIYNGDSLELLKKIPDHSVSLILTDPPYHTTKKKNIIGDCFFKTDEDYIAWKDELIKEWKRVLKPNGSIYCYCSAQIASRLEVAFSKEFKILSHIVWTKPNAPGFDGWKQKMKKESLRQWYGHTERIIFAEPAAEGNLHRSYFANFLRETRLKCGLSGHQLTEFTGAYGKVNHGGAVSNWETGRNVPSREQYQKICDAFLDTGKVKTMPHYNDLIRPFNVTSNVEFTDVWNFQTVRPYKGKHPAEKPLDMLMHAIEASTYEGDLILDCFAGSGSTVIAALAMNRKAIGIEIDPSLCDEIANKIEYIENKKMNLIESTDLKEVSLRKDLEQVSLGL